jgi:hypothetical protein
MARGHLRAHHQACPVPYDDAERLCRPDPGSTSGSQRQWISPCLRSMMTVASRTLKNIPVDWPIASLPELVVRAAEVVVVVMGTSHARPRPAVSPTAAGQPGRAVCTCHLAAHRRGHMARRGLVAARHAWLACCHSSDSEQASCAPVSVNHRNANVSGRSLPRQFLEPPRPDQRVCPREAETCALCARCLPQPGRRQPADVPAGFQ